MLHLRFRTEVDAPVEELAAWHARPGAFERLSPPWQPLEVIEPLPALVAGARARYRVSLGPVSRPWLAEIAHAGPGGFTDIQVEGPFARWSHRHRFLPSPAGPDHSRLEDEIRCELPLGCFGHLSDGLARQQLEALFAWRQRLLGLDLQRRASLAGPRPLHLLITGTGLIGRELEHLATTQGHRVTILTRSPRAPHHCRWDPLAGDLDLAPLLASRGPLDAVAHLAGAGIAEQRWSESRKREIRASRVDATDRLARALAALPAAGRPSTLLCASGISGLSADGRPRDERAPLDRSTFLGELVADWEAAARPAEDAGIRTVFTRFAAVLDPRGGALAKLLPVFRAGAGGPLGDPSANFPWIALEDAADILLRACHDPRYRGPIHVCTPQTPSRRQFARALGHAVGRPALIPTPALALRLLLGRQMADETALADIHPLPSRLLALGYPYRFPAPAHALYALLGQPRVDGSAHR